MIERRQPTTLSASGWLALIILSTGVVCFEARAQSSEPVALPPVNLDNMDRSVRDALEAARGEFDQVATQTGDPVRLGYAYATLGRWYHAHGLVEAAAASYRNALALAGDHSEWHYLLAILLSSQGQFEAAREHLSRSLDLNPRYPPVLIRRARIDLQDGRFDQATSDLNRALQLRAQSAAAMAEKGRLALELGEDEDAVHWLTRALEIDPAASQLRGPLAIAYRNLGDQDRASRQRELSGSGTPTIVDPVLASVTALSQSAQFFFESGVDVLRRGNLDQGIELLARAVELKPDDGHYLEVLGRQLFELGRMEAAAARFNQLLDLDPDQAVGYYYLGRIAIYSDQGEVAQRLFEHALQLTPGNRNLEGWLARSLLVQQDFDQAADRYRTLADQSDGEDRVYALYWQGMALIGAGRCAQSGPVLDSALRESEELHGWALLALARVHAACPEFDQADPQQALLWAERLYEANHGVETAATMAMVHAALGEFDAAVGYQAEALFAADNRQQYENDSALNQNMARYREEKSALRPYSPDDPVFARYY